VTDTGTNAFGQPIGFPVEHWTERVRPSRTAMVGRYCRLEPLDAERHARDLFEAYSEAPDERDWTYLVPQKPASLPAYGDFLAAEAPSDDPLRFAVVDIASGQAVGRIALMRIDTLNGVIEVGGIMYSRRLQRRPAGTEAIYLCAQRVFDELGYRRFEWKCDALNAASRAAAVRYGFTFEGIFRQAMVYHGRNRDTAWYSMLDGEWPRMRRAFECWLDPDNFDEQGQQRRSLAELRED
jgi:RimJ/RimL family protein N-acetyltransferase